MDLYGYRPTAELDAIPKLEILDARFQPVDTPGDFGHLWRALEMNMQEGEIIKQRNPYFKTVYNVLQLGMIHRQAEERPEEYRPAQSDLDKFWEYGRIVSRLRGFVLLDEMA
jgi:hypothetical protein